MPRLLGKNPAYRKHKASGQAVVTLAGRDFYLGPWNSAASKAEYNRRVREWNAAGGVIATDRRDELTVVELLAAFKRHAKAYYVDADGQPSTEYKNYSTLLVRTTRAYGR